MYLHLSTFIYIYLNLSTFIYIDLHFWPFSPFLSNLMMIESGLMMKVCGWRCVSQGVRVKVCGWRCVGVNSLMLNDAWWTCVYVIVLKMNVSGSWMCVGVTGLVMNHESVGPFLLKMNVWDHFFWWWMCGSDDERVGVCGCGCVSEGG